MMVMMMMMVVWWLLTNYMKKCPAHLQWTTVGSALGFIFCLNSRTNLWMITINPWHRLDAHWLSPNQCVRKLWNALVRPVGEMKLGKKTLTSFPIIHLLNPELPKKHIFHVFTLFWVWGKPKIALTIFEKLEKTWSSNWHPASLQELGPARYINKREWNEVTPWRSHRWLEWSQSANSESTSPSPSPPGWSPSPSLWTVKMLSMENLGNWLT